MKSKSILLAALCATNIGLSHAAPTGTSAKTSKPALAVNAKSTIGAVVINAVTRNDAPSKVTLQLAENGEALMPIVISAKASDATKAVAKDLASYLEKISGATFKIEAGDGTKGIYWEA